MPRTALTRIPEKASTDRRVLDSLLDAARVGHIGLVADDSPVVLATTIARDGDRVLVHGSTGSRWMRLLAGGLPASLAVTEVNGLVVARSAFESSMQYRSAVVFGTFSPLTGPAEKARGLDVITESLLPGRVAELRPPSAKELAATLLLALTISQWSLKVSDGWPEDPDEDVSGAAWAGVVPLRSVFEPAVDAPDLRPGISVPPSVQRLVEEPDDHSRSKCRQ